MTSTAVIRILESEHWQLLRDVRLRTLTDSPEAFSRTVAEEQTYDETEWRRRLGPASSAPPVRWLIAEDGGQAIGLACGRVDPQRADTVNVFAMWVEAGSRRRGVGKCLLRSVVEWARTIGARRLLLGVAASCKGAVKLYESVGFIRSSDAGTAGQSAVPFEGPLVVMTLDLCRRAR